MNLNTQSLALPKGTFGPNQTRLVKQKKSEHRIMSGRFLKGPIPLDWLFASAQLPGKTLEVAIALWFLAGVNRSNTVRLSNKLLSEFGVDRHAKRRALLRLMGVGLISIVQKPGCSPVITILDLSDDG